MNGQPESRCSEEVGASETLSTHQPWPCRQGSFYGKGGKVVWLVRQSTQITSHGFKSNLGFSLDGWALLKECYCMFLVLAHLRKSMLYRMLVPDTMATLIYYLIQHHLEVPEPPKPRRVVWTQCEPLPHSNYLSTSQVLDSDSATSRGIRESSEGCIVLTRWNNMATSSALKTTFLYNSPAKRYGKEGVHVHFMFDLLALNSNPFCLLAPHMLIIIKLCFTYPCK